MTGVPIIPKALLGSGRQLDISPGMISGDHVFLTGMTGSLPDGSMPENPAVQFRSAFDKIAAVLAAVDLDLNAVVEMTSYHIDLQRHFDQFDAGRLNMLSAPYPAWTAVEVAGLRRQGALVEIRAVAHLG